MPTPPAVLVADLTETKPEPPGNIATDPVAGARYSADLESWGERLRAAGLRACRWLKTNGAAVACPEN